MHMGSGTRSPKSFRFASVSHMCWREPEFSKEREVTRKGTTLLRREYISRMDFNATTIGSRIQFIVPDSSIVNVFFQIADFCPFVEEKKS